MGECVVVEVVMALSCLQFGTCKSVWLATLLTGSPSCRGPAFVFQCFGAAMIDFCSACGTTAGAAAAEAAGSSRTRLSCSEWRHRRPPRSRRSPP